jgi:peptide deformylase
MAILPITNAPDARLRVRSSPVETIDDGIRRLADDMLETMYGAPGIGLSAIQVDIPKQIIVIDLHRDEKPEPIVLINPEILVRSDETAEFEEGCLSFPTHYAMVRRFAAVEVRYTDRSGHEKLLAAEGALATCVQHEMDHLSGVLFVDHISRIKRDIILRKLVKTRKLAAAAE